MSLDHESDSVGVGTPSGLAGYISARRPDDSSSWIRSDIGGIVRDWIVTSPAHVVLEIGGGRSPLLGASDLDQAEGTVYIVNDREPDELAMISDERYERACFDIQVGPGPVWPYIGRCDLVFSNMVFEHVEDPRSAWKNSARLLRSGGQAMALVPTLYSPPFVLNRIMPERLSRRLLRAFFPNRNQSETPKFPAYYRWCRGSSEYLSKRLLPLGFRRIDVIRFYGHSYFNRIPIVSPLDAALTKAAARRDWSMFSTYAAIIASK